MLYTVDRVQFELNGEFVVFEFYNLSKDDINILKKKYDSLSLIPNTTLVVITYDDNYLNGTDIKVWSKGISRVHKWEDYKKWFLLRNAGTVTYLSSQSKTLGSATQNEGDPYVHEVLKKIHGIDLSMDDSGLGITKAALGKTATYGFDFDIFDDKQNIIVEFLNNETKEKGNNPIENTQAHLMRYSWISEKEQANFAEKNIFHCGRQSRN